MLSDGSRATLRAGRRGRARPPRAGGHARGGASTAGCRRSSRDHRDAIANDFPRHWRQAGGYRLDRLAGDDPVRPGAPRGRLGGHARAVTEARSGWSSCRARQLFAVGHFDSVAAAIAATDDALELRRPSAIELIDRTILDLSRAEARVPRPREYARGRPRGAALRDASSATRRPRRASSSTASRRAWRRHGHGYHTLRAETPAEQDALTKVRKAGPRAADGGEQRRQPAARLRRGHRGGARAARRLRRALQGDPRPPRRCEAGFYGHCSVGCLHIRPYRRRDRRRAASRRCARSPRRSPTSSPSSTASNSRRARRRPARSGFNRRIFGDELYEAMRGREARSSTRDGRLNPGKIVDAPPMTERPARPGPAAAPPLGHDGLSTSPSTAGMRGAADRCQRHRRLPQDRHRGRCARPTWPRARRSTPPAGAPTRSSRRCRSPTRQAALGDERLHEILDLCLECKACKSECPLSVDMAKLKASSSRTTRTSTACRCARGCSGRSARSTGSARRPRRCRTCRCAARRCARCWSARLGIARERPLPRFARETLRALGRRRRAARGRATRRRRVPRRLLHDVHRAGRRPRGDRAARGRRLPRAPGERRLLRTREHLEGAARPGARGMAADMVDAARAGRRARRPIVGCEPSCLLTLRDEYLEPAARRPARRRRSPAARLVEELLSRRSTPARCASTRRRRSPAGASSSTATATRRRSPARPRPSRCSAHPGRRGRRARRGLLRDGRLVRLRGRALRAVDADRRAAALPGGPGGEPDIDLFAATGVSCRQQIAHGTGREGAHPVELVRQALAA